MDKYRWIFLYSCRDDLKRKMISPEYFIFSNNSNLAMCKSFKTVLQTAVSFRILFSLIYCKLIDGQGGVKYTCMHLMHRKIYKIMD